VRLGAWGEGLASLYYLAVLCGVNARLLSFFEGRRSGEWQNAAATVRAKLAGADQEFMSRAREAYRHPGWRPGSASWHPAPG
jgi:hypothetical protein